MLSKQSSPFDKNGLFIGKVLIPLDYIESTNQYALELLSKTKPIEGTVIIAHNQTHGRGQIGTKWISEAGMNVTLSIILYPKFIEPSQQFLLNQIISLSVRELVDTYCSSKTTIKWPNDIYCGNKKIAGILIQNALSGNSIRHSVVGIGLNVNQVNFPSSLLNPTSLKLESNIEFQLSEIWNSLFKKIEIYYLMLKRGDAESIKKHYLSYLYLFGETHLFNLSDRPLEGKIIGVDKAGQLMVESKEEILSFNLKEITF